MGYQRASEMIEIAGFDIALTDHLTAGIYPPPLVQDAREIAVKAIDAMVEEDYSRPVTTGGATAEVVCAGWHLDVFVSAKLAEEES